MEPGYKTVKRTEESILGFVRFLRRSGLTWILPPKNPLYAVFVPVFSLLGAVHLLYSASYYSNNLGDMATVVYFSLLCLITVLINLTLYPKRKILYYLLTEACRSYDYGGEIMRKVQKDLLYQKNMKLFKQSSYLLIMELCLMGNLVITSLIEKFFLGQRYLSLYPSWFPSSLRKDLIPVNFCTYALELLEMTLSASSVFTAFGTVQFVYTHLTSELLLLCMALGLLKERAMEMVTEDGMDLPEAYMKAVRASSEHHACILEYFNEIQPVAQIIYTMIYSLGLILLIFTGLVLSSHNSAALIKFVVITLIELSFIFTVSWFSEEIAERGRIANAAVYDVDWTALPPECVSSLRILLVGSQRPLYMKTYFGQVVNLDSYMGMLKAAYSYFNMTILSISSLED